MNTCDSTIRVGKNYFIAAARIAQIIAHSGQSVLPFLLHLGGHDSHEGKEILKKIFLSMLLDYTNSTVSYLHA